MVAVGVRLLLSGVQWHRSSEWYQCGQLWNADLALILAFLNIKYILEFEYRSSRARLQTMLPIEMRLWFVAKSSEARSMNG